MFRNGLIKGLFVILLALAGCGGAGGGGSQGGPGRETRPPIDYATLEAEARLLHDTWDDISFTDPSSLPMSGSATYSGIMQLDIQKGAGEISMDGLLNMKVSFANNAVSGTATNFIDENNANYSGKLTLSNGMIDRGADPNVDYTLQADIGGTLSGGGKSFDISADLQGDFHGSGWKATSGGVQGSAVSSYGTGYVFGEFVAAR
ncbi:MAG: hypothetical protein ACU0CA_02835 [Paracoccaceae bacterium]